MVLNYYHFFLPFGHDLVMIVIFHYGSLLPELGTFEALFRHWVFYHAAGHTLGLLAVDFPAFTNRDLRTTRREKKTHIPHLRFAAAE